MTRLLGLVGRQRSGKDTFARGLANQGYARVAFADPLRDMVEGMNPFIATGRANPSVRLAEALAAYGGWEMLKDSPYGPEARRLLQNAGQEVRRLDEGFWMRVGLEKARLRAKAGSGAVITDVRYANEARAVQDAGGYLVRVVRPGLVSTDLHVSETELDDYPVDFTVTNGTTAEALEAFGAVFEP